MRQLPYVAVAFVFAATLPARADDPPAPVCPLQRVDARELAELERTVQGLYARLSPSVVRLKGDGVAGGQVTGAVVSPAGDVLTCAHHSLPPGKPITALAADGTEYRATTGGAFKRVKGRDFDYYAHDLAVVKVDGRADWPVVELGRATGLKPSTLCVAIGHPYVHAAGQPPLLRLGRVIRPPDPAETLRVSCRILQGDSGGPVFTLDGKVVGVCSGNNSHKRPEYEYEPIDSFAAFRKRLLAGEHIDLKREVPAFVRATGQPFGAVEPDDALAKTLTAARPGVVEVFAGKQPLALGLVVAADGLVVTKRSDLTGYDRLTCRLADGREVEATPAGGSAAHDLLVLKVAAKGLTVPAWGGPPRIGQLVASVGTDDRPLHVAVVGAVKAKNPGVRPELFLDVADSKAGVVVERLSDRVEYDGIREAVKPGDVITHFNGRPTPTVAEYVRLRDEWRKADENVAGDRVVLTVRRGDASVRLPVPTVTGKYMNTIQWKDVPLSHHRTGFPDVFVHDGGIAPARCGSPVVDRAGRVIGLNIARADEIQSFAIPGSVVRELVETVRGRSAGK